MLTYRITALGRVQGVGFRPLICRLAGRHHITGTVRNEGGVVTIIAQGSREALLSFMGDIQAARPPVEVAELRAEEISHATLPDFRAISSGGAARAPLFPADLGICEDCLADMRNPKDHHYGYPYTSCTACGPRYTMIEALPYDRERTAMKDFPLCKDCEQEYESLSDRRCHAESIACAHCGPQLKGWTRKGALPKEAAMAEAIRLAKEGAILLVKAMGGYQLVCRGDKKETVLSLRRMKHRSGKPFALMMKDIDMAKAWAELSKEEVGMLTSPVRPILLAAPARKVLPEVAFRVPRLGICLPSTGFYAQLSSGVDAPLIVTSANRSGEPMICKDEEARAYYEAQEDIAGLFFYDREILHPADDSVMQRQGRDPQLLRRTRGFLPEPVARDAPSGMVLATGADMAPGFALAGGGSLYPAEVPCDIRNDRSQEVFQETERDWEELLGLSPQAVISDRHPAYLSRMMGETIARERGLPFYTVQHHHAHALSVMAEHHLREKSLAFVFDGTGYGEDGSIWGGEILFCEGTSMQRVGHLAPVSMIGGDASMKQAWKSALSYLAAADLPSKDPRAPLVRAALSHHVNTIENSSMGRLFDAAASLLGLGEENHFKGECPMALEAAAMAATHAPKIFWEGKERDGRLLWDGRELIRALLASHGTIEEKALAFHEAIAEMILSSAEHFGLSRILLSGGCFLNQLLLARAREALQKRGFSVYTNEKVPPGDGGIALGQAWYGLFGNE